MEDLKFDPNEFVKNVYFREAPNSCVYGHRKQPYKIVFYDENRIDPVKYWLHRPRNEVHDDCDVLKIRIFWMMLFEKNTISAEGCKVNAGFDVTNLGGIEFLEDFIDLFKSVADIPCFVRGILSMENKIADKTINLDHVLEWVKATGNTEVVQRLLIFGDTFLPILGEIVKQYSYSLNKMISNLCSMKKEEEQGVCTLCIKKSESSKTKGNKEFSKENYESAVKLYTKAVQYHPENHILYGNRALCYLRIAEYKLALADGKRAIILKQTWYKGHYRFCDALFLLGEYQLALAANEKAQKLCKMDPDGVKELSLQTLKFIKDIENKQGLGLGNLCASNFAFPLAFPSSQEPDVSGPLYVTRLRIEKDTITPLYIAKKTEIKDSANKLDAENIKKPLELPSAHNRIKTRTNSGSPRRKSRMRSKEPEKPRQPEGSKLDPPETPKMNPSSTPSTIDLNGLQEKLKTLVENGYTALLDQCFHSAEQAFSQLLDLVDPAELKKLHIAMIDYVVLIYGHARALLGIGQPEELTSAEQQFNKIIEKYTKQRFNCLAFYGIGNVHLRRNRFEDAKNQFIKCQIMLNRKIVPGVLKWPTTSVIIEETRPEKLQMLLEKCIEECKFPPKPDAICRYPLCKRCNNKQIYFTDPDFEGFIRLFCCHLCKVEFHMDCWKTFKTTEYSDKNDKDCLKDPCCTPDCKGIVCRVVIYGSTGLVKWQGETKITKFKGSQKPIVKQKNSSPKKLKVKQERKLRRKLHEKVEIYSIEYRKESMTNEENSSKQVLLKADTSVKICGTDPMLELVKENAELIKTGVQNTSLLVSNLFTWLVINQEEHIMYSASITNSSQYEVMAMLINQVIKKNDKVKTRIFLHVLSQLHEVDIKLRSWLTEINDIGLLAADVFLSHYLHQLLQLDLESLCCLWNETYGNRLNSLITSSKLSEVIEYFDEESPELKRCLVWFLEEYKELYKCPVLYQALDKYFNIIDHPRVEINKHENQDIHSIKVKNKTRKKKQKESKPLLLLPGGVGTAAQELDHISAQKNVLDSNEPVVVLENIHDQVAEFESTYEDISRSSFYSKIMNNKAVLTQESLYEYFYEILDKHGPLELDSDLLVGEYNLFPPEAHKIVEEAGGLKPFLLGSLRFVMLSENLIGSLKHTFLNTEATATLPKRFGLQAKNARSVSSLKSLYRSQKDLLCDHWTLNPGAKEFKPVSDCFQNSSNSQDSSNNSLPATQNDENIRTVNTLSVSNTTINSQPVPFIFSADKASPFVGGTHLLLVPPKDRMQPVQFLTPASESVVQAICSDKSEAGIPECEIEVACDTDGTPDTVSSSTVIMDKESSDTQNPHRSLYAEDLFLGSNSSTSVNFVACSNNMVKNMRPGRKSPFTKMVAVQVVIELSDHSVNTDTFHPFEKRQGDILRMEKEHQVLQEQLKEATEKYELSKSRNTDEVTLVKEKLQKVLEENKISKSELDWFYQDLENEVKKWQQEKKEHQERLRVIRNNIKVLMENNESCLKSIEEKEQQYKTLLNGFLESSNKFENEKLKFEENIKKCKDNILESKKRAVASEVTILENQKNIEIFKLCCAISSCEANLHVLRSAGSSVSAPGHFPSQIISWNNYLSSIKNEIQNIKSQFEVRINLVQSGAKLSSLQPVQVETLQSPPSIPIMQSNTFIDYPAVLTYSTASQLHNSLFPEYSSSLSECSVPQKGSNTETSTNSNLLNASFEVLNISGGRPPSKQDVVNQSFQPNVNNTDLGGSRSMSDVQPLASQVVNAGIAKKNKKNPYDKLIAQLNAIFPHYDGAELSSFVKAARVKNGNSFSELDSSEVISRVTEFILDYQSKTSSHKEAPISSDSLGQARCERKERTNCVKVNGSKGNPLSTKLVSQSTQPWKCVAETPKSNWLKSNESALFEDDPCIICHEELRQNIICVLECGHRFHKHCIKTWLNAQSTCPTCRVHVLLSEDFPVLTSRKRPT